jgi:hypothetical protein
VSRWRQVTADDFRGGVVAFNGHIRRWIQRECHLGRDAEPGREFHDVIRRLDRKFVE